MAKADKLAAKGVRLVCADCGHSVDPQRQGETIRRSWMAASGLGVILLLGCLTFAVSVLQEAHYSQMQQEPEAAEARE